MHGDETFNPNSRSNLSSSWSIWTNTQSGDGYDFTGTTSHLHSTTRVSWTPTTTRSQEIKRRLKRASQWAIVGFSFIGVISATIGAIIHQTGS